MLKRNFAATTEQIGSPHILIDQPHFLSPVDWASVIDEYQSDIEEKEKKDKLNALANALQTGDEETINSALAAQNPTGYAERLYQMKLAKEKRAQELEDNDLKHQRSVALESLRSDLASRRAEAAHERELALEQLKRDWLIEDKAREREQALEDEEAKRQDFYAQEAFKKELESQYKKQNPEKLPTALYYANELDKLDPDNPAHQPRIKILKGLLAKEMTVANGKSNIAKEIQLLNRRAELDRNNPVDAEEIALIDNILSNQKQGTPAKEIQLLNELEKTNPEMTKEEKAELIKSAIGGKQQQPKDTRTAEEKRYDFAKAQNYSEEDAVAYAMKTGKFAPNQGKPAKTLEQIYAEEMAKADAKASVERKKNIAEYDGQIAVLEDALGQIFGDDGLALRANIGYEKSNLVGLKQRLTPTMFTPEQIQEARGAMANIVGMVRLGLTDFLKGSVSNYEQQLLQDVSSGNITWYTPKQIKGALEAMLKRFKTLRDNLAGGSSEKKTNQNSQKKQPVKILSITEEK